MDEDDDDDPPELLPDPTNTAIPTSDSTKILPVTVITGFLGAGKTTLLNYLLCSNHGKRIAIIENEFSAGLGVEGMIAKSGLDNSNIEGFFELSNGCICCTVKDTLLTTLEQLVLHKHRFDYIIIETTGVANPGPVISTFWTDESLGSCLKLDGVVCVVDTSNLEFYLQSPDTVSDVQMQISYADRVLLNKSDLVSEATINAAKLVVSRINAAAEIRETAYSKISSDWVLDIDCYSTRLPQLSNATLLGTESIFCAPCLPPPLHLPDPQMHKGIGFGLHSASLLGTLAFTFPGSIDVISLRRFLDGLLYNNGLNDSSATSPSPHVLDEGGTRKGFTHSAMSSSAADGGMQIFRMKGILQPPTPSPDENAISPPRLLVLQAVHNIFDIQPSTFGIGEIGDTSGGMNHVIVIGLRLDGSKIGQGLQLCVQ